MAGDDEPIVMADRPEFRTLWAAADPPAAAAAYGALAGWLSERTAPLLRVLFTSRGGDPDLETFAATIDQERLVGATMTTQVWESKGWLQPGLTPGRARDTLWTLNSPAVFLLLHQRGWTVADYQNWLAATLLATVLAG